MTYKYYSIHRPIGIGTIPNGKKPESIVNYGERKEVTALDGRKLMAWGEVSYTEPLTEHEMYQYELSGEYEYPPFKHVGYWMEDTSCEIIKLDKRYFVLYGWNGSEYGHCWECLTKTKMIEPDKEYTLTPILFASTSQGQALMNDMYDMEEGSDEWCEAEEKLNQIVSYMVSENC